MGIEQLINQKLNNYPVIKKTIKRFYQRVMYTLSPKIVSEGDILRVSPDDEFEYFFGYYDKTPWDVSERYMLCLKVRETFQQVAPNEPATIIVIDTLTGSTFEVGQTHSWNVQQGCMLQWFPNTKSSIIYNDYRNNAFCSVILDLDIQNNNIEVKSEKLFSIPIYSVSSDGSFALSLDFSRLHDLAPGYGYFNKHPKLDSNFSLDQVAISRIDFSDGKVTEILTYRDFTSFEHRSEMSASVHKVNHIMISPNNNRFMVLHRWFKGEQKYTRLVTCNIDGSEMYNLSDDDMVSHCWWKDDNSIFAFERKKGFGAGYFLMTDKSRDFDQYWQGVDFDGHPSFSPIGDKIVFDSYPDKQRVATIRISKVDNRDYDKVKIIAKVHAPFRYDNELRCDLHPRWNRSGTKICFDAAFEGKRGLYIVNVK